MRLSQWRTSAPVRDALSTKVSGVLEPVLESLGAEPDPHVWVAWGDDPGIRYTLFAPTAGGLIVCHLRLNVPGEGARASAKLVRWNRVQLGEMAMETQGGHRMGSFQVESQILRGADEQADAVAAFALTLLAGADGRPLPEPVERAARRGGKAAAKAPGRATRAKPAGSAAAHAPALSTPTALAAGGTAEPRRRPTRGTGGA